MRVLTGSWWRRSTVPPVARYSSRDFTTFLASTLQHAMWGGQGADSVPSLSGAVRVCEGAYSRALSAATVSGPEPAASALQAILPVVGVAYPRSGEFTARVRFGPDGSPRFVPVEIVEGAGSRMAPRWTVREVAPSGRWHDVKVSADNLLHVVWHDDGSGGLRGEPPWTGHVGRALANLENSLGTEARLPTGQSLRVSTPSELDDMAVDEFYGMIEESVSEADRTGFFPMLSQGANKAGPDSGMSSILQRYGPEFASVSAQLETVLLSAVLTACGLPAVLLSPTVAGSAWRDAWRSFLASGVSPISTMLARAASETLGMELTISVQPAHRTPADAVSQARAVGSLRSAGVELERALHLAGFE